MTSRKRDENLDQGVIDSFGHEWATFDYGETETTEALNAQFKAYCAPIDLNQFNTKVSVAADFGAGSGRWASRLIPFFSLVYALEPSDGASKVLKNKFADEAKIMVGVLHHIPDTSLAIKDVSLRIKPGGMFLCYLYYNLENKPTLYKLIFKGVNVVRKVISGLPQKIKHSITSTIAALVYWPLARFSKVMNRFGVNTSNIPLHHYADMPFVMLANDALDRFGTSLEQRFSKAEITEMLRLAEFDISTLKFSDAEPFWTFSVRKH